LIEFPIIGEIYHRLYYAVIKRRAYPHLTAIDIETYNVCNLRCTMCPYPDMTREKVLMSMDLFKKIINDATTNNIRQLCLNFYNEPLLDPLLFERIKYAKSKGLRVMFNSNGCLLTGEKISALLDSGLDSISFSFDGAKKETYEKLRVGANFEKTVNNIMELIKERNRRGLRKPSVTMYFVAQKHNYQEISKFKSFWKKFADRVSIGLVDTRRMEGLLPEEFELKKLRRIYPCREIFQHMLIMSNGKVALCCVDYDGSIVLGDLNQQTINELWNSNKINKIRELHLSGQGDKIKLCRDTSCGMLYEEGSYRWK
jgi:MoaA/NifB/PqqE/SkfB family radical SAM enzyme